jgi:hypothetical protein
MNIYKIFLVLKRHTFSDIVWKIKKRVEYRYRLIRNIFLIWRNIQDKNILTTIRFLSTSQKITEFIDQLRLQANSSSWSNADVINDAKQLCKKEFNLLDNDNLLICDDINWCKDYLNNYEWRTEFYSRIKYINKKGGFDVKNCWELNRFNHLYIISQAYFLTGDKLFYQEIKAQIMSWIEQNPFMQSVNWTCTMEVAIRAFNWLNCYFLIREKVKHDNNFHYAFVRSLLQHELQIRNNLENYSRVRNNHYFSNLLSLFCLRVILYQPSNARARDLSKLIKMIDDELNIQVYQDGVSFEGSTNYHFVMYEMLVHVVYIAKLYSIKLPISFFRKLRDMRDFLYAIRTPEFNYPLIGDNDSGRLMIYARYFTRQKADFSVYDKVVDLLLYRTTEGPYSDVAQETASWFALPSVTNLAKHKLPNIQKRKFSESGFYVMANDIWHSVIRCGPLSMFGQGGHSHNDQLSFTLAVYGKEILVDAGSSSYTGHPSVRNRERSTRYHNTVFFKDVEQNPVTSDLFSMPERSDAKAMFISDQKFIGEHYGFGDGFTNIHSRTVELKKDYFQISDRIYNKELHERAYFNLILNEHVIVREDHQGHTILVSDHINVITSLKYDELIIEDIQISKAYGCKVDAKSIFTEIEGDFFNVEFRI